MVAVSLLFAALTLVLAVGGGLLLFALVRSERDRRRTTDRETAEALARSDTDGDAKRGRDRQETDGESDGIDGNHWQ